MKERLAFTSPFGHYVIGCDVGGEDFSVACVTDRHGHVHWQHTAAGNPEDFPYPWWLRVAMFIGHVEVVF